MDVNPFKLCSGLKVLGYFMIPVVVGIVALSYYAVVILSWGPHLLGDGSKSILAFFIVVLFHILLVLLTWCYLMAVLQDPGSVPSDWRLTLNRNSDETPPVELSAHMMPVDGTEQRPTGYCTRCQKGKPPRCHHCSVCQRCVLKMDHHCIWVVNCVGARNYKFFLLFVMYTFLETTLDTLVLLPNFIRYFHNVNHHDFSPGNFAVTFLAFVLNLAFAFSLLCFVIMHASLLLSNTTSVEVYEKVKGVPWKYDLGWRKNFEQVFGTRKALWFFPVVAKEDLEKVPALRGLEFPIRPNVEV